MNEFLDIITKAVKREEKTKPYDTTARVTRIDGDTAWVHIDGGVDETPVKMTISASEGDTVQVRVSGGTAFLVGNATAPPTDDTTAIYARTIATDANNAVRTVRQLSEEALGLAGSAMTSANGKNTVYHMATAPTGGTYQVGDTWFNSSEGYAIYTWNGTQWVKEEIGEDAIADLAITNAKIADATIQSAKISGLDVGKLTGGYIAAGHINTGAITVGSLADGSDYSTTAQMNTAIGTAETNAKKVATNYITDIDSNNGITIKAVNGATSGSDATKKNYIKLNASGLEIYKGGESVAQYGDTVRIGREANGYARTLINTGGMQVVQRSSSGTDTTMANIGYGSGNAQSGTAIAPYYTFGVRSGAIGNYSVAEGNTSIASGYCSHAEGYGTGATKICSHAEGNNTSSNGYASHSEGQDTQANADNSHAGGQGTIASGTSQTAIGKYNVADTTSLFIIGNGTSSARSNALSVAQDGTITSGGAKVPTRKQMCYANSRVDNFVDGQITLSLASLGITTGQKPVGILMTYQDGGATPTILRYDYDASSSSGVVIKAYNSSGGAVSGNVRYFAVVFQNSWTSVT